MMKTVKMIFGNLGTRVWFIVTAVLIPLFLVVSILATTMFYDLLNTVMPGGGIRFAYDNSIKPIYASDFKSKGEAYKNANEVNIELCEEGMTLLKNDNNALPIKTPVSDTSVTARPKVSIFGKNSYNIAYGGSGSGGADAGSATSLYSAFEAAGYDINPTLVSFYKDNGASGEPRKANSSDLDSGKSLTIATAETPYDRYSQTIRSSYGNYSDAAFVVFTRVGGEGFDLPRTMAGVEGAYKQDDHYLQIDKNERDLLTNVTNAGFKKVIVIINSGSTMELTFLHDTTYLACADKIDAAVWMGYPGISGTQALGNIINGSVNPSGKTVDTYAANFKNDPTFVNFGDNNVKNGDLYVSDGVTTPYYFVDYEESIYAGYRYYETRGYNDEQWYDESVIYPLGYGMSYTTFAWTTIDKSSVNNSAMTKNKIDIKVEVQNTGLVKGKDVVQVYATAPYTAGEIEKAHKVLVGFAKTKLLEPNEKQTLTISIDPYDMSSYDYKDANKNGFAGYELDDGRYTLSISKTAHDVVDTIDVTVSGDGIRFDKDNVTGYEVKNLYTDQEDEFFNSDLMLKNLMSRADFEGTAPSTPTEADRKVSNELINAFKDESHNNPNDLEEEYLPWFDEQSGLKLRDMLYKAGSEGSDREFANVDANGIPYVDYDDERWMTLLEQCSAEELITMIDYGAFKSNNIQSVGKPRTNDTDGPVGFVNFMDKTTFYGTCSYACEVVIASTWSVELARKFGEAVGEEGIWGDSEEKSNGMTYSGWYAPGVNTHRSPFGGRNFEYFSEDGFLSGKIAAAQIQGCQSKGVYCYVKHFALNEQETHRSISGSASWVTEQAMREIYLKPFEFAVKEGGSRAMMTSFNRIGTRWTGGDYRLNTEILRNEWGFKGTVICDFNTNAYMNSRQMAYSGGDLNLATQPKSWCDPNDTPDAVILMQCVKNIFYTVVNSNAMNKEVIGTSLPIWTRFLIGFDCALVVGLGVWGFFAIKKAKKRSAGIIITKKDK